MEISWRCGLSYHYQSTAPKSGSPQAIDLHKNQELLGAVVPLSAGAHGLVG